MTIKREIVGEFRFGASKVVSCKKKGRTYKNMEEHQPFSRGQSSYKGHKAEVARVGTSLL